MAKSRATSGDKAIKINKGMNMSWIFLAQMPPRARAVEAAPPPVGEDRDAAQENTHERHQQNVLVANMRDLVRHHALSFLSIQERQQAGRHADRRVLVVGPGGERIGRRIEDDVNAAASANPTPRPFRSRCYATRGAREFVN